MLIVLTSLLSSSSAIIQLDIIDFPKLSPALGWSMKSSQYELPISVLLLLPMHTIAIVYFSFSSTMLWIPSGGGLGFYISEIWNNS